MRTSLIEIREIERWIEGRLDKKERLLFEAKLIVDKNLKTKVDLQKGVFNLVRIYGRERLRDEVKQVEKRLLTNKDNILFQQQIYSIFKP